nr:MAG TPA: hypothetical protein [Caudoviricetes sp.]
MPLSRCELEQWRQRWRFQRQPEQPALEFQQQHRGSFRFSPTAHGADLHLIRGPPPQGDGRCARPKGARFYSWADSPGENLNCCGDGNATRSAGEYKPLWTI